MNPQRRQSRARSVVLHLFSQFSAAPSALNVREEASYQMASTASSMGAVGTPAWVVNVREEIGRSPAWEVLSDQLFERVSTVLKSHGLGHFSDLSSPEQITLLEEAHRDIMSENNKVYQAFESQFSKSMDAEIAKEARARVVQDSTANREGTEEAQYLDRILDSAAEGAVSLLRELPREHLGSLRLMLNQAVPSRARLDIWRLLLKHTAVLLESGSVASRRILPLSSRNVVLMKTVLSYHHACKMTKRGQKATTNIPEPFVHFLVPLCAVITGRSSYSSSSSSSNAAATATTAAASSLREQEIDIMIERLVEMFEGALEAGLEGLVDQKELPGGTGVSGSGAGGVSTTRAKKSARSPKTATRAAETKENSGDGRGGADNIVLPDWVDKSYGVLVPGFRGLLDHVTRVHLGLAVAAVPSEGNKGDNGKTGDGRINTADGSSSAVGETGASNAATDGQQQQPQENQQRGQDSATQPTSPRRTSSATSRRAALLSQGQPSSEAPSLGKGADGVDMPSSSRTDSTTDSRTSAHLPEVTESQARVALWALLEPLVTVGLVGHLGADACLFAWDQAVIAGFGVMLPRVAAMVVAAAADKLGACLTFAVMSEALFSHAHLVSTSQLQELMEAHCMPSIRKEMRVSHKLCPEITGPTLKTATDILDSAYSKRTREAQEARKAHVEHTLGPSRGGSVHRSQTKERIQLDLSRTAVRGSSRGSSNDSNASLGFDDDDDAGRSNGTKDEPRASKARGNGAQGRDKGKAPRGDEKQSSGAKKNTSSNAPPHRNGSSGPSATAENAGKAGASKSDFTRTRTRGRNASNALARTSSTAVEAEAATASKKPGVKNTKQKLSAATKRQASVRSTRKDDNEDTESQTEGSSEQISSNDSGHNQQRHDQKSQRRSRGRDTSESYSSNRGNGEGGEKSAARSKGERRNSRSRRTSAAESSDLSEDEGSMTVDGQSGNKGGSSPTMSTPVAKVHASDRGKDKKKQDGKGTQLASADDGGEKVIRRSERAKADNKTSSSRRTLSRSHERSSQRDGDRRRETKQGTAKAQGTKSQRHASRGVKTRGSSGAPSADDDSDRSAETKAAPPTAAVSPIRRLFGGFGGLKKKA
ncbi:conserved unknown protein [Ectocarpus siliculosus]|uniref:Uncharacterized protein n=1 Tax=Ectocarpus siliculosus TaxID=2880 RepID=D7FVV0_ECTSI|nr:conserved unknown protein [Ectocarpus siliculosus]|eukprot:CBJ25470.1 conserved unknown protein [Ectocarpus siliculosus]